MAVQVIRKTNGCTFYWKIENIRQCWLRKGSRIRSPTFIADALECTKWSLTLYPMGKINEHYIGVYLNREEDCMGPAVAEVNYQLAILDKDGSILKEMKTKICSYPKASCHGFCEYEEREKIFVTQKETFISEDTLRVQCTIWKKREQCIKPKHLYARTIFNEDRKSFAWRIYKFSILKHDVRNKFKDRLIDFDLALNKEQCFDKELTININSFHASIKYISLKASIIDSNGIKENCGFHEYFSEDMNKVELSARLFTKKLIGNKNQYLPIDVLCLDFQYVSSTKAAFYESSDSMTISKKFESEVVGDKNEEFVGKEDSLNTAMLAKDLKFMYIEGIFSDAEIRTSTQTFPVHKSILSARSPVFRSMFSNDMKEKNSGCVNITDLKHDTVCRMLLFIYTDSLEDLQFQSAYDLYTAADKYQILPLKNNCSAFLKENLCRTNSCDVLALADLHNDDDLKDFVLDYILRQSKDFFNTREWKDFLNTHLKLAADVMQKKIFLA